MVGRQNADIADTLQLRGVAMATSFWLSMGYNFGCVIASDMLFVFGVKLSDEDIADFEDLTDIAMATILGFLYMVHIGATWRMRLNRPCAAAMGPYVKLLCCCCCPCCCCSCCCCCC